MLPGDFVTTDAGTGLVIWPRTMARTISALQAVRHRSGVRGRCRRPVPRRLGVAGRAGSVINKKFVASDGPICTDLRAAGALLAASDDFKHSYPHSWRSKAKVIFRATPQWFIPMDRAGVADVDGGQRQWRDPARTGARFDRADPMGAAARREPHHRDGAGPADWVISRQRAWGVPIALYVNRATGEYLNDPAVNARIVQAFPTAARTRGSPATTRRCWAMDTRSPTGSRRTTFSTCGSIRAARMSSPSRRATARACAPISISRVRTSIAAGSSRRCWKAAARAAARPMTRC